VDYPLFTGSILSWEPNYAGGMLSNGTVTVTANDALATLALHTFDSRWVEETRALARTAATWADVYVLKGDASTAAWDNVGITTGGDYGTATIVPRTTAAGEISYGTPASLTLESGGGFKPAAHGLVASLVPAAAPQVVSFWVQVPTDASQGSLRILTLRNGGGEYGSIRLRYNGSVQTLSVHATSNTPLSTLVTDVADGAWRLVTFTARPAPRSSPSPAWTGPWRVLHGGVRPDRRHLAGPGRGAGRRVAGVLPDLHRGGLSIAGDTIRGARLHGGPAGADVPPHRPVRLVPVVRAGAHHVGDDGRRGPHRRRARLGGADGPERAADPRPDHQRRRLRRRLRERHPRRGGRRPARVRRRRPWTSSRTWTRRRRCRPCAGPRTPARRGSRSPTRAAPPP
jgi:hypothetical protein